MLRLAAWIRLDEDPASRMEVWYAWDLGSDELNSMVLRGMARRFDDDDDEVMNFVHYDGYAYMRGMRLDEMR